MGIALLIERPRSQTVSCRLSKEALQIYVGVVLNEASGFFQGKKRRFQPWQIRSPQILRLYDFHSVSSVDEC